METRKDSLSALKLCRFCLSQDETLRSLYDRSRAPQNAIPLPLKILSCVSVEVFPSDKMPQFICKRCSFFMDIFYEYKQIFRQADETILQYVQSGAALEPIVWPASLVKAFRQATRPSEVGVVKTIVEGGATIEVTSQDMSDSEEDEENVYSVKIGDGSDEGGSTCIKVVTSKENLQATKEKSKQEKDSSEEMTGEAAQYSKTTPAGCWPCDECDCTFPLQQLLELHKIQKHRERTVTCDICDAKFFTKYDLTTHQLRHSSEVPFECVACGKRFKRLVLLKRHERLIHADLPQQKCPNCPASFLSIEELQEHQKKHIGHGERPFACPMCDKKFYGKGSLQRHKDVVHPRRPELSCEYCPERFSTVAKLTRHVRSHAGDRPYPCKYCEKSFMKSHHYTRHMRIKHHETIRTARGPFGMTDQYRCEQCEDSFATQDELIYHSAIHATQNLICPLCQEKFENVDAVTAHIKSHVNGMEFMCELCELVFTTKEKLDTHFVVAHDEELRNVQEMGQDESSMELDAEEEDDDNAINVKEVDGQMVVEITKPDNFLLSTAQVESDERVDNTNSEESETDITYTELSTVDTLSISRKDVPVKATPEVPTTKPAATPIVTVTSESKPDKHNESQPASILRKAEEMKRKVVLQQTSESSTTEKKEKTNSKVESSNSVGGNDKSLRLLEKELQELKRTTRIDANKTPIKPAEQVRTSSRRPQLHTSTPKLRSDDKKIQQPLKTIVLEKKQPERRAVKENKEPKDVKEPKTTNTKEEKEVKTNSNLNTKEDAKEKETPKTVVKNGSSEKPCSDEGLQMRRSTRPSKIKDYAKMIRDRAQQDSEPETDTDDDDEEYTDTEKTPESRGRGRRSSIKQTTKTPKIPIPGARKRGRPRKDQTQDMPSKIKKNDQEAELDDNKSDRGEAEDNVIPKEVPTVDTEKANDNTNNNKGGNVQQKKQDVLVSPSGQTLKKVPVKALPPGVKPIPLSVNPRPMGPGELCEMQIGKKVVKVQKIVMTKAEVEAMAKKGLVEMKDGTMVLKQGIKIPTSDPAALKSSLVGEDASKEPSKKDKATPMRCDIDDV